MQISASLHRAAQKLVACLKRHILSLILASQLQQLHVHNLQIVGGMSTGQPSANPS